MDERYSSSVLIFHCGYILSGYFISAKPKRVYADFRIVSPSIDPAEVTELLGIIPTGTSERGNLDGLRGNPAFNIEGLSGAPCPDASWFLSTETDSSINLDHHLQILIKLLFPKIEILRAFREEGHNLSISGYILTSSNNVESHVSYPTLQALAQLSCKFWTDVYFDIGDEGEETDSQ